MRSIDAHGIEADQAARIDFDAPDVAFFVDRRTVRKAAQLLEAREQASRTHVPGRRVVVVRVDRAAAGVGKVEAFVRLDSSTVRWSR